MLIRLVRRLVKSSAKQGAVLMGSSLFYFGGLMIRLKFYPNGEPVKPNDLVELNCYYVFLREWISR